MSDLSPFKIMAFDFETTGVAVATLGVCQSALCIATLNQDGTFEIHEKDVQLLNPIVPIEPGAAAIHGYDNLDVADKPLWTEYLPEQFKTVHEYGVDAHFGFNIRRFDCQIGFRVGLVPAPTIDMYVAAAKLKSEKRDGWTAANLGFTYEKLLGRPLAKAHDAFADVLGTLELVEPMIKEAGVANVSEMIEWMKNPDDGTPNMKINFGKNKGQKLKTLDRSYVKWLLGAECTMTFSDELRRGLEACL